MCLTDNAEPAASHPWAQIGCFFMKQQQITPFTQLVASHILLNRILRLQTSKLRGAFIGTYWYLCWCFSLCRYPCLIKLGLWLWRFVSARNATVIIALEALGSGAEGKNGADN